MSLSSIFNLRARLVLLVLVAVLPALGLILYSSLHSRSHSSEDVQSRALAFAKNFSHVQDDIVENGRGLLFTLSQIPQVQRGDGAACATIFANLLKRARCYSGFMAARPDGEALAVAPPLDKWVSVADRAWYRRLLESRDFTISEYLHGRAGGRPAVGLIYPVLGEDGQISQILIAAIDLGWLNQYLTRYELPADQTLTVIDRDGTILVHYPPMPEIIGKALPQEPIISTVLSRREGVAAATGLDGIERLFGFTPLGTKTSGLYVLSGIPAEVAHREGRRDLLFSLICFGGVGLLALAAAWFCGDAFILRQVKGLLGVAEKLEGGDLSIRLGPPYRRGELGYLARAFDQMAASLQSRQQEAQDTRKALEKQVEEHTRANERLTREVLERQRVEVDLGRKAEELARSNAELEQFAYVASHDLQEPIRIMTSYLQLLERRYHRKLDADAEKFIARSMEAANRMKALIEDLLALSRVGTRGKPFEPVNCEDMVDEALASLKIALQESGGTVNCAKLPMVRGDGTQLVQLFQNLIANALKFRRDKRPLVHIAAALRGREWVFSVRDNGIGIEPESADRIFGIFQRLHTRSEYAGTGIGLAICKKVVERHGGRIWVESTDNGGSNFLFTIPLEDKGGHDGQTDQDTDGTGREVQ